MKSVSRYMCHSNYAGTDIDLEIGKIIRLRIIGIDEIPIRLTCVSDLDKGLPLWIGGEGRREEDMDLFYHTLSEPNPIGMS